MVSLKGLEKWSGLRRQRTDQERRTEKERKRRALAGGGAEGWLHYDYFLRAQRRGILGIPDERCFTLQSAIRSLAAIPGDVAECGVRFGKSAVFLLEADLAPRRYHLFDSFEGLSEPSTEDAIPESGLPYWKKGDISTPEEETRKNLSGFDDVAIYRGWIPERFPEIADRRFALVHVDVDLYEPTCESLAFFWPRLVDNGILVCDDYGSRRCPGAKQAMDEFFAGADVSLIELTTGQALVTRRRAATTEKSS
jgi:hypothetical protein